MKSRKILFIQTAFIGDAILSLPALQKLKEIYPDFSIDVLCNPESEEIFKASASVDEVIVLDKKGIHKSLFNTVRFANQIKKNNYVKLYSSHRSFRTSLIVFVLGVKESYGFDTASLKFVYKNLVKYNLSDHEVQRNLSLVGFHFNQNDWRIKPEVISSSLIKEKVLSYLNKNKINNNFIAIAPGSIWETKKYPQKYFEEVINYLTEKKKQVLLIGGVKDKKLCSSLVGDNSTLVFDTSGLFSIIESIELLKHANILISNDSAPTHLGMAAGIKVLTIYCSTTAAFGFYPYSLTSRFVSYDNLDCKPCGLHGYNKCPLNTFDCGLKLSPKIIIKNMEEMSNDN
jgi:heptosyltransferase-2